MQQLDVTESIPEHYESMRILIVTKPPVNTVTCVEFSPCERRTVAATGKRCSDCRRRVKCVRLHWNGNGYFTCQSQKRKTWFHCTGKSYQPQKGSNTEGGTCVAAM
ncbi:Hypothetical predicted protein [Scomber scombrus]|uniref:Uncharacterized protein n=1 Tax=Scomber scombrus TaxID=13677 RepID=A0AAV1NBV3_SCOSC